MKPHLIFRRGRWLIAADSRIIDGELWGWAYRWCNRPVVQVAKGATVVQVR